MAVLGKVVPVMNPTTALADGATVPVGKEWVLRCARACNKSSSDTTVTLMIAGGYVAFNYPVRIGEAVNIFGPDSCILPAGTLIRHRAGSNGAIDLMLFVDERDA